MRWHVDAHSKMRNSIKATQAERDHGYYDMVLKRSRREAFYVFSWKVRKYAIVQ